MRCLALTLVLALTPSLTAADWPQFLGPNRDNTTTETVAAWTAAPKSVWKVPVGDAHSSPVVADGVVYAFYQPKGKNADALAAFDAKTGATDWQADTLKDFGAKNLFFGISTSPLVVDDKVVVMVGGKGAGVVAFDRTNGKPVWKATDDPAS